jgi:hypothetical protein
MSRADLPESLRAIIEATATATAEAILERLRRAAWSATLSAGASIPVWHWLR